MAHEIRQPKQERSIEKKHKIVQAGYQLFAEVGYYNTNTAQIAKRAGVSTGIVYGYFKDKRDILLDVLAIYIDNAFAPILDIMSNLCTPIDFATLASRVLDCAIQIHKSNANIHEALHSMSHSDKDVNDRFIALEDEITLKIAQTLVSLGVECDHINEKIHFTMDIVQSFSHEYVYDSHPYINYGDMRKIVQDTIVSLFR